MAKNIIAGIDIGTSEIKVVLTEELEESAKALPKVIATGFAESKGMRHGYITNIKEVTDSIVEAILNTEKNSGLKIKRAVVSIGGISLGTVVGIGTSIISRGDAVVMEMDMDKATETAEKNIGAHHLNNRRVVHTIPLSYKIDGKNIIGRPQGMKGNKLEAKVLFITCLSQHLDDLIEAITEAGIEVLDIVAVPIASSVVTLSKNQKVAGCVLADIGSETTSIIVYENNLPISLETFSIGSNDITNDIALGLKISIEDAERLKKGLELSDVQYSKKKLDEIIEARLSDIFELIESHLKKIDKNGLLPAGIIITGGSINIKHLTDLAKEILKLPAKIVSQKDAKISVAYGLSVIGLESEGGQSMMPNKSSILTEKALNWLKQFLP